MSDKVFEKVKKIFKKVDIKRKSSILVGTNNYFSDLFFIWVFSLIFVLRNITNFKDLNLMIRECDTASHNDNILEEKWEQEKQIAKRNDR
jgi:hypothetical protein